jgi:hypothetical protein
LLFGYNKRKKTIRRKQHWKEKEGKKRRANKGKWTRFYTAAGVGDWVSASTFAELA